MTRNVLSVLLVVLVVGCGSQPAAPVATYLTSEPMPPEVSEMMEQGDFAGALAKVD